VDSGAELDWRQLGALDRQGNFAVYHGRNTYSLYNHSAGRNYLALGSILDNEHVTVAMRDRFEAAKAAPLSERLLLALEASWHTGGEIYFPLRSAALRVTVDDGLDRCVLRVDDSDDPISALRCIKENYATSEDLFQKLTLNPGSEPVNPGQKKPHSIVSLSAVWPKFCPRNKLLYRAVIERIKSKHPPPPGQALTAYLLGYPRP